jgi:putative oxidoreductase
MNGWIFIRVLCGCYFIPHTLSKTLSNQAHRQEIAVFFGKAGLKPVQFFIYVAAAIETCCAFGLITGIRGSWAAWLAGAYLGVAVLADVRVGGLKWLWVHRGCEYPFFWMLICFTVAANC